MAALHTSSMVRTVSSSHLAISDSLGQAFTHALYDLSTYPEYLAPMREEVEHVVAAQGWTKAALGDMHKVDSFIRESQRVNGLGSCA
jgi:hypothetical protein